MISKALARQQLLSMANEDIYGLYEAVWELRGFFPDNSDEENRELAEELLMSLIAEGLIELFIEKEIDLPPGGCFAFDIELTPVPQKEVGAVLARDKSWEPFERGNGIGFLTTESGTRVWLSPHSN